MIKAGERAHTCTGSGHREAVPCARDALVTACTHLTDQFLDTISFIELRLRERIHHQCDLIGNAIG